jgi:hypothetical protein
VLWVPSEHPINVARLALWYVVGPVGLGKYYEKVTASGAPHADAEEAEQGGQGAEAAAPSRCPVHFSYWAHRAPSATQLCGAAIVAEALLCAKCSAGVLTAATPPHILVSWVVSAAGFGTLVLLMRAGRLPWM